MSATPTQKKAAPEQGGAAVPQRAPVDWELIERHYRAGILSLREIAKECGVTEGAIRKRAKKDGWARDLTGKIQQRADDLVRKEAVRTPSTQLTPASEKEVVEANAELQYRIRMAHRQDIGRTRSLFAKLMDEVESQSDNLEIFEKLGELLDESGTNERGTWVNDKLNEIYRKVISTPGRVDSAKKLTEILEKVVKLERQAFGLDDDAPAEEEARQTRMTDAERAVRLFNILQAGKA